MSEAVSKTKASKGANQEGLREMRMVAMGGGAQDRCPEVTQDNEF